MKKKYLLTAITAFFVFNYVNAQTKSQKLGFGAELDATFGDINEREDFGYGYLYFT